MPFFFFNSYELALSNHTTLSPLVISYQFIILFAKISPKALPKLVLAEPAQTPGINRAISKHLPIRFFARLRILAESFNFEQNSQHPLDSKCLILTKFKITLLFKNNLIKGHLPTQKKFTNQLTLSFG